MTSIRLMSRLNIRTAILLCVGVLSAANVRADATCTTFVSNTYNTLRSQGARYWLDLTIHRFNVGWVSYSTGAVTPDSSSTAWPLRGATNQLFSDRSSGNQPFTVSAQDQLSLWISSTGRL